jgi:streptomycin 6-kinase
VDFSVPAPSRLVARHGARAEAWWAGLAEVVAALAARWDITVGEPVGRGNTSPVVHCRRADGRAAILKLSPDPELARAEATALRAWRSSGRVPALWGEAEGALLLEAVRDEPPDGEPARVAALIGALHACPIPPRTPTLAERVEFVFTYRPHPGGDLARELAASGGGPAVLLHGDLHPANVLDGGSRRGLVAIDPRACAGDPAFDAMDWVFWQAEPATWQARAGELAARLGCDEERLWAWCTAFAAMIAAGEADPGRKQALLALVP